VGENFIYFISQKGMYIVHYCKQVIKDDPKGRPPKEHPESILNVTKFEKKVGGAKIKFSSCSLQLDVFIDVWKPSLSKL